MSVEERARDGKYGEEWRLVKKVDTVTDLALQSHRETSKLMLLGKSVMQSSDAADGETMG